MRVYVTLFGRTPAIANKSNKLICKFGLSFLIQNRLPRANASASACPQGRQCRIHTWPTGPHFVIQTKCIRKNEFFLLNRILLEVTSMQVVRTLGKREKFKFMQDISQDVSNLPVADIPGDCRFKCASEEFLKENFFSQTSSNIFNIRSHFNAHGLALNSNFIQSGRPSRPQS